MSNRREARERVMQALYAHELAGGDVRHFIDTLLRPQLKEDAENLRFAESLFLRTLEMQSELDEIISRHAENWDLSRIALIDHIVLRMSIAELLTFEDIPPKVSINEAIEIVKRYSTSKSGQFINGILDAVLVDLQDRGLLKKSGRGLVGMQSIKDRSLS
ncbi:MAG: transcription antitermination factor NusB [Rhodothermales bacterium]